MAGELDKVHLVRTCTDALLYAYACLTCTLNQCIDIVLVPQYGFPKSEFCSSKIHTNTLAAAVHPFCLSNTVPLVYSFEVVTLPWRLEQDVQ